MKTNPSPRGRKPLEPAARRCHVVYLFVTADEKEAILQLGGPAWIRSMLREAVEAVLDQRVDVAGRGSFPPPPPA